MAMMKLSRFWRSERAVSAVEFALVFPVMLVLFFGAVELGSALIADRKAASVAATVADLVAQGKTINDAQMADVFTAANAILAPFDPTKVTVVVSSIYFDPATTQTKVRWSKALNTSPLSAGDIITLPTGLLTSSTTSIIMSKSTYFYQSDFGQFLISGVTMNDTFYDRPRLSVEVTYN